MTKIARFTNEDPTPDGTTWFHWCPACETLHPLPDRWQFDGNVESPTFSPSFRQFPSQIDKTCHYNIEAGQIRFHADSWHKRNETIPMPDIPADELSDWFK